jgi:hypothetical protein
MVEGGMELEVESEEASLHGKSVLKDEAESLPNRSGSESSSSNSSSTSSSSKESYDDNASNGSSSSVNIVDASNDVPISGVSNTAVVSTAEVIVAVAAATSKVALSSTKLSYRTLGDKVLVEKTWLASCLSCTAYK